MYVDLEEALGYIFGCFREDFGPLKFFFPLSPPHQTVGICIKEGSRRKEKEGGQQAERVNPTSRPHQTQRSHLLSRCTPRQFDVTRWWLHRCPRHLVSLVPAAPQPCAAESLDVWLKVSRCGHHSQEARRT